MKTMICPNGHELTEGIVCGGSTPYGNHGFEGLNEPNVYFYMELETGHFQKQVFSELPFELDEKDWAEMFNHASGGCVSEPQCPICLEYLD
jgi:hypothetical protein